MCIFWIFLSMIAHFCLPAILVPAELFGPHTLSYSNIWILTLNTMAKPYPEKLHLTCANDHDSVRVCHWTIANHSLLLQMHWLLLYCVNDTLLGHAMSFLKISLCPVLALMQIKWIPTKSQGSVSSWKEAQAAAGQQSVNRVIFSRGLTPKLMKLPSFAK